MSLYRYDIEYDAPADMHKRFSQTRLQIHTQQKLSRIPLLTKRHNGIIRQHNIHVNLIVCTAIYFIFLVLSY